MSTPRMWKPVLNALLAEPEIRRHYQFWFFYYPTGHPVPFSALQLRQALTAVASRHKLNSTDGVVPYSSSHLNFAESELVIPAGHGGFAHPEAINEIARILKLHRESNQP